MTTQPRMAQSRPMKATKPYGGPAAIKPGSLWSQGSPLAGAMRQSAGVGVDRRGSPASSPKDVKSLSRTPVPATSSPVANPRRASSLSSLHDPPPAVDYDMYMNSVWPKTHGTDKSVQTDSTGLEHIEEGTVKRTFQVHKRSSSYGNTYSLERTVPSPTPKFIPLCATGGGSRGLSSESLEISEVLRGKEELPFLPQPVDQDGRMAPVSELDHLSLASTIGGQRRSVDYTPTPPLAIPSFFYSAMSSVGTQTTRPQRSPSSQSPPGSRDPSPDSTPFANRYPSSPKTTFNREPPDGADRCIGKPSEPLLQLPESKIQAPDVSKAKIRFTGGSSAFTKPSC